MNYVLVENKKSIILGPIPWRPRAFQSELLDLDVDVQIPTLESESRLQINDQYDIFPVDSVIIPDINYVYEELVGPFWTFNEFNAKAEYTKKDRNIEHIKSTLKEQLANERYRKENSGVDFTVQNSTIRLDTSRENRQSLINTFNVMLDNDTISWKFKETWLTLSKTEIQSIVSGIINHVQSQFDWEKSIAVSIDSCESIEELKQIVFIEDTRI